MIIKNDNQRLIFNTGILYGKVLISMFISLYSTRLVLSALGVSDFGIFNLVGGVVALFAFINSAMSTATQRFLSYYLGSNKINKLKSVFHTSVILHLIIGVLIVIVLEVASIYLFNGFLNIPVERLYAAKIVFQFVIISTFFTINAVPYDAIINAHENMLFDSLVGILESILRLIIALWLINSSPDRLISYGLSIAALTILIRVIKSIYCHRKYIECKINFFGKIDLKLLKEMFSFAGWNLYGALSGVGKTQGLILVLNIFMGTIIVAAYSIAIQVSGQLNFFSQMMLRAINPQIMKSEGADNRSKMMNLSMNASKFGFLLLSIVAIPFIFELPAILQFWLKEVPEYTVLFCSLVLIAILVNQLTIGLDAAIQASGNIKYYMIIVGSVKLMIVPFAYLVLFMGKPVAFVVVGYILFELLGGIARLFVLKYFLKLEILKYLRYVFIGVLIPVFINVIYVYGFVSFFNFNYRFIATIISSGIVFLLSIYLWGLNTQEKNNVNIHVSKIKTKFLKK
jgi:Na+-driven multidrug efflux pump